MSIAESDLRGFVLSGDELFWDHMMRRLPA